MEISTWPSSSSGGDQIHQIYNQLSPGGKEVVAEVDKSSLDRPTLFIHTNNDLKSYIAPKIHSDQ